VGQLPAQKWPLRLIPWGEAGKKEYLGRPGPFLAEKEQKEQAGKFLQKNKIRISDEEHKNMRNTKKKKKMSARVLRSKSDFPYSSPWV